jgi:hypothetical protein
MGGKLIEQLKKDGVKYVRWSYCGSNDEGYIVEIKTFDSAQCAMQNLSVFNNDLESKDVDRQILEYGNKIFDGLRGFEINDGGYGWILLNTDSGEVTLSEHWNERGLDAEFFPFEEFSRVEFEFNDEWEPSESDASAVKVVVYDAKSESSIVIGDDQKRQFILFDRIDGKKKRGDFFERGGQLLCKVNGSKLRDFISSIGQESSSNYYFFSEDASSRSEDDIFRECTFAVSSSWDGHYLTVLTGGWSESFKVNVLHESDVIERNPTPSELECGLG